jgi:hypothetical protein
MTTARTTILEKVSPRMSVGTSSAWPNEPEPDSPTQSRGGFPDDGLAEL